MIALLIFVCVLGLVVALAAPGGKTRDPRTGKMGRSTGEKIALGIAVALGALGLAVVGFIAFFMVAMNNWANNK